MLSSAFLLALLISSSPLVSGMAASHSHTHRRHTKANRDLVKADGTPLLARGNNGSQPVKIRKRKTCRAHSSSALTTGTSTVKVGSATVTKTSTTKSTSTTSSSNDDDSDDSPAGNGKPSNWPTATQAGPAPTSWVTTPSDPNLEELSKSYNNVNNDLYHKVYTGDMTYYAQGLGACGDTYDDKSFTAAISHVLYDKWPGASSSQNLNPVCGPFVPGRKVIGNDGVFRVASKAAGDHKNFALIGGDGRINCDGVTQCHIPLTATVKHGGKSIQVKIVDRCAADTCKEGDIDLTPAAFAALADMSVGRTDVTWHFNKY